MSLQAGRTRKAQGPPPTAPPAMAATAATGRQPVGNGAAATPPLRPREARQARFAQAFAKVVAVLMRDPNFRTMPLADLEWLVLPAVMSGQFRVAEAPAALGRGSGTERGTEGSRDGGNAPGKAGGVLVPVAVALWARVSGEIDAALAGSLDQPVRLKAHQWASGEHVWLVAVAGDRRALPKLIDRLVKDELKGRRIKMRVRGPDNTVVVKTLGAA